MSVNSILRKLTDEKGIGLVETLLALGVAIIIITSMVSLSIFTLRASLQNKLTLVGTQLANQEVEQIRAYRDSNVWADFIADVDGTGPSGIDCFSNVCHMVGGMSPTVVAGEEIINEGTAEEVHKSFQLSDQSGGDMSLIRVAVTVSWQLGGDTKYSHNYTELSDWRSF